MRGTSSGLRYGTIPYMTANPIAEATIEQAANTNYVKQNIIVNCIIQHKLTGYVKCTLLNLICLFLLMLTSQPSRIPKMYGGARVHD